MTCVACCLRFVVCYVLFGVRCAPFVVCRLLSADSDVGSNLMCIVCCLLCVVRCWLVDCC